MKLTKRTKLTLAAVAALLCVVAVLGGIKAAQIAAMIKAGHAFVPPPIAVAATTVRRESWDATTQAVGSIVAVRGVSLGAEAGGRVRAIHFDSGTFVKSGAPLVELDASTEQAQLDEAVADDAFAQSNLVRVRQLIAAGADTKASLDDAESRARKTSAAVESQRATIAKLTVLAPFDGRVAVRRVELGQILAVGAAVASLQTVDPIYVDFRLPQHVLSTLHTGMRVDATTDAYPQESWTGKLTLIDTEVDESTRNVLVRATFKNPGGKLLPGMFVNVAVVADRPQSVLVIPTTAVVFAPYGDSVFVIDDQAAREQQPPAATGTAGSASPAPPALHVHQRIVRLGKQRGDFVVVTDGLADGEHIVSAGAFKLKNEMAVVIAESGAPAPDLAPKPPQE
jgi:membrane fusion protein (multidrug efflux system)